MRLVGSSLLPFFLCSSYLLGGFCICFHSRKEWMDAFFFFLVQGWMHLFWLNLSILYTQLQRISFKGLTFSNIYFFIHMAGNRILDIILKRLRYLLPVRPCHTMLVRMDAFFFWSKRMDAFEVEKLVSFFYRFFFEVGWHVTCIRLRAGGPNKFFWKIKTETTPAVSTMPVRN